MTGESLDSRFLVPDELGYEADEAISQYLDNWLGNNRQLIANDTNVSQSEWDLAKAELMDNVYAIIKQYQSNEAEERTDG